jgi:transposase-like protein
MSKPVSYKRHRFPPEIIAHAVWLYLRRIRIGSVANSLFQSCSY